jgi:hypothetical protein
MTLTVCTRRRAGASLQTRWLSGALALAFQAAAMGFNDLPIPKPSIAYRFARRP